MSGSPMVSVVMPMYNAARYLAEAIESVLAQTLTDLEFIIADDGSTDRSVAIAQSYADQDERVRIIRGDHGGPSIASNLAASQARAPFLARMDADDICMPERIARQVQFLTSHPEYVAVGCQVLYMGPDGLRICEKVDTRFDHEQIDKALIDAKWPIVHPTLMIRRLTFESIGGYQAKYDTSEDHDLFLRLAESGMLANLREPLFCYRQHFNAISFAKHERQRSQLRMILEEAFVRRGYDPANVRLDPFRERHDEFGYYHMWAWWALNAGRAATARRYARRVLRSKPFSPETWRLMFCAARGH